MNWSNEARALPDHVAVVLSSFVLTRLIMFTRSPWRFSISPANRAAETVAGLKAYASVRDAPGVHVFADQRELMELLETKLAERTRLRATVQPFSVDYWVQEHDKLFRRLITGAS